MTSNLGPPERNPAMWFGAGTFVFLAKQGMTLQTYNCGTRGGVQTIPIDPPLTVSRDTWIVVEWREGDATASARVLGPEEPTP